MPRRSCANGVCRSARLHEAVGRQQPLPTAGVPAAGGRPTSLRSGRPRLRSRRCDHRHRPAHTTAADPARTLAARPSVEQPARPPSGSVVATGWEDAARGGHGGPQARCARGPALVVPRAPVAARERRRRDATGHCPRRGSRRRRGDPGAARGGVAGARPGVRAGRRGGLRRARRPGGARRRGPAAARPRQLDLVVAFDVLEHLEDDVAAVREVAACCAPAGRSSSPCRPTPRCGRRTTRRSGTSAATPGGRWWTAVSAPVACRSAPCAAGTCCCAPRSRCGGAAVRQRPRRRPSWLNAALGAVVAAERVLPVGSAARGVATAARHPAGARPAVLAADGSR